jgi:5-methylcytosine-specific restriction endonuclease McrA
METREFWRLGRVSDEQLRAGLSALLANGYRTEARIIAHIAEVEERKLHLREGSESLFDYCTTRLGLSNSEAFHRITASRIARRFPIVFTLIEKRELNLTAVCLLRDYLCADNHRELLAAAAHKTKLQIQEMLAGRFPRPDVESRIRKLPAPMAPPAAAAAQPRLAPRPPASGSLATTAASPPPRVPARGLIVPTSAARYRIQLNASAALKEKLELLQALTSHSNPSGDLAVVIERALDLAIERAQQRRFAKTERPRETANRLVKGMRSRLRRGHIPNATRREVVTRDGMRCTFVGGSGERCTARAFLQIHHEHPWARGGADTTENLRVLCGRHNRLLAERDFGAMRITKKVSARQTATRSRNRDLLIPTKARDLKRAL